MRTELKEWLDRHMAKPLWEEHGIGGQKSASLTAYSVKGGAIMLVHLFSHESARARRDGVQGFELYVPASASNNIAEMFTAAERVLGLSAPHVKPGDGLAPRGCCGEYETGSEQHTSEAELTRPVTAPDPAALLVEVKRALEPHQLFSDEHALATTRARSAHERDRALVVHAPAWLAALVARVEELEAELKWVDE